MSDERRLFRETVRSFVEAEVLPKAEDLDQHGVFPQALFQRLGDLGFLGLLYPPEVGGQGADFSVACVMYEELARGSLSLAAICAMQSLMGTHFVYRYGTEEHRNKYLRPALAAKAVAAFALTEPDAGSDLGAMRTRATKVDGGWVINGTKTWVTNAPVASFITVGAKTGEEPGIKNIALFLVDAANPGFTVGKPIDKLGVRSSLTSEVAFEDCYVAEDALLGGEGEGARNIGGVLSEIRVMTAALAVGLGRRALEDAVAYAQSRQAFGRPIAKFQAIEHKLAVMQTELYASSLMTYDAAARIDRGEASPIHSAMAKLGATEACAMIVDETTRIFGSYGFAMEYPAQRYFRDARFLLYGGGTSELLRGIIGRGALGGQVQP
ncbi:MAG: acyl-CoA dehydrogenase family protein [Acidimicrobiia bacterium]